MKFNTLARHCHWRTYLAFNFPLAFFSTVNHSIHPTFPGIDQNAVTVSYSKLLSQLSQTKALLPGQQIHAHLFKVALDKDSKHRNHLINLYSKCGLFLFAREMIEESPETDLVSWSSLISGYVQNGFFGNAISTFYEMYHLGISCNEFTYPCVLKACAIKKDLVIGREVHGVVYVSGYGNDIFVLNSLLGMYAKCGEFVDARRLFDEIPEKNVVSWNAMFSCYTQRSAKAIDLFSEMVDSGIRPDEFSLSNILNACTALGDILQGKKIHGSLVKLGYHNDQYSYNALVDMYAKIGDFEDVMDVFEEIPDPDIVSWNAIIAGCVFHDYHGLAIRLLGLMKWSGLSPNMFTLSSTLKACAGLGFPKVGRQIHSFLVKMDTVLDQFVYVGLIDMYCKCNLLEDARLLYDLMPNKDLIALNAIVSGYSSNQADFDCLTLFAEKYKSAVGFDQTTLLAAINSSAGLQAFDVCAQIHTLTIKSGFHLHNFIINSLVDAYGKCNRLDDAVKIFGECPLPDLPSFTSIITAHAQYGQGEDALRFYLKMQDVDLKPDSFVCSSLLNACANLSAFEQGKQIHIHVLKLGFMSDVFSGNSLVNMYAKCGSIEDAGLVFSEVLERNVVSYSAMIGGLAQHGHGTKALQLFENMLKEGVTPNHVTLVNVLYACNHAGLVTEARRYFQTMKESFGIEPTQEHYACMIDVLGRAGKLNEAKDLASKMPFEANGSVWGALLGAARIHKDVELGEHAAEMLSILQPDKSGTHVLLANIYASAGLWENVARVRRRMKGIKVKKEPGMSWVEVKGKVYTFIVGDRSQPRSEEIYNKLEELGDLMIKAGYVPMIETDLHNVEQQEKEKLLLFHSEKLAVAFALLSIPPGAPIIVKKNLRICVDCHTAFKFISKIVSRVIIIRDINRFHHFQCGSCSCGDYW
ncbi:hypothetical protein LIER_13692 [Lithospermum erythrorhizon]|uniref:DYW domain-containing protein n=1 Tax=Lithospermum erythrorhizon TaxID=34254 RepID=A0AAV3PXV9_LITER